MEKILNLLKNMQDIYYLKKLKMPKLALLMMIKKDYIVKIYLIIIVN